MVIVICKFLNLVLPIIINILSYLIFLKQILNILINFIKIYRNFNTFFFVKITKSYQKIYVKKITY